MIEWVAEIGSMHKGDKSLAFEMIRQFSQAGATICKFQFGWTQAAQEKHGLAYNPARYVDPWAYDLKKWCDYFDVKLMASIWSREGLTAAQAVGMKYFKVSRLLNDDQLRGEMENMPGVWFTSGEDVYVVSEYPVYPERLNLPASFGISEEWYGYSDHCHGIEACLLAAARGALYIEKHVCLDKTDLTVRDTPFAATPDEFAEMVKIGNGMRRLLDAQG